MFSLTKFAEETATAINRIGAEGIGGHQRRSLGALSSRVVSALQREGFTHDQAVQIWRDCKDMASLLSVSDED